MATTTDGWPYVVPTDHPLEYPAVSQQLANLLDTRTFASDTAWTAPGSLLNGWLNYGSGLLPFRYRKLSGLVTVMGCIKSGTISTPIFTLPTGYRITGAAGSLYFPGAGPNGSPLTMAVDTAGAVSVAVYGTGASNTLVGFSITYPAD